MSEDEEVVVIDDEWSRLSADEYRSALDAWIAERGTTEPVVVSISAAEVLRTLRCDTGS